MSKNISIGVARFSVFVDASEGRRGVFRKPTTDIQLPAVKISRGGTPDAPHVVFETESPPGGPLQINGLEDPPIPLCIYDQSRTGETLTISLLASLDHDFICVRAADESQPVRVAESMNRGQVIKHLAKLATLGDLACAKDVTLVQTVSINEVEPE